MTKSKLYVDEYFGGKESVRNRLSDAIRQARKREGFTQAALDELCGFGEAEKTIQIGDKQFSSKARARLSDTKAIEDNPNLLRSQHVSLATAALGLRLTEVLPLTLSGEQRRTVAQEMRTGKGAGVLYGSSGPDPDDIPLESQAELHVLLRVLSEIDD